MSIVVVDLPIATDVYGGSTPDLFEHNGLELDVVPVPLGTPDITPQAQHIAKSNPDGLVSIVGPDAFCIAALQGLRAVDFQGPKFMIQQCLTDSTREALSGGELEGIKTVSLAPLGDDSDASMRQYQAVLDTYATTNVDPTDIVGLMVFQSLGALSVGTQGLNGAVTPAAVTAALKGMDNAELPGSGGRHFRCDGKASTDRPAVCSVGVFVATLDAEGNPESYTMENDEPDRKDPDDVTDDFETCDFFVDESLFDDPYPYLGVRPGDQGPGLDRPSLRRRRGDRARGGNGGAARSRHASRRAIRRPGRSRGCRSRSRVTTPTRPSVSIGRRCRCTSSW